MKILYLFSNLTYPPKEGLHEQTLKTLELLHSLGHDISVTGFTKNISALSVEELSKKNYPQFTTSVIEYSGSILRGAFLSRIRQRDLFGLYSDGLHTHHQNFDIIICEGLLSASILKKETKHKAIVNLIDSASLRNFRLFKMSPWSVKHFAGGLIASALEYSLKNVASQIVVVSSSDQNYLQKFLPKKQLSLIPISTKEKTLYRKQNETVNGPVKVLIWIDLTVEHLRLSFKKLVEFLLQSSEIAGSFEFHVLCRSIDTEFIDLMRAHKRIYFVDWVSNLDEYLGGFEIALLPDLVGTGLKNRLLDCIRNEVLVIATPTVLEGFLFKNNHDLLMYADVRELKKLLLSIRDNHELRKKLSENASRTLLQNYGFESVKIEWSCTLEKVVSSRT